MSAGKGGPSNPIGGPAPMPGQPSPGMPAQDPYNRPEATNLPRYAGQPGYPGTGTGPYTPRPDLGPDVGFGPGLPTPTPMPMPGMPGGKAGPAGPISFLTDQAGQVGNVMFDAMKQNQDPNVAGVGNFFGTLTNQAVNPVIGQMSRTMDRANQYTRTRTNPGNRYIPPNAPGR